MSCSERTAESVEQVTAIATELRDKWIDDADLAIIPWFRGQTDAEWPLRPKFDRMPPS